MYMELNSRLKRISLMEARFNEITRVLASLEEAVDEYNDLRSEIDELRDYMVSGLWKKDFEADEAGMVPSELKRGVLSEDGLYNLLHDADAILEHAKEVLFG